jgi:hypothetical protein
VFGWVPAWDGRFSFQIRLKWWEGLFPLAIDKHGHKAGDLSHNAVSGEVYLMAHFLPNGQGFSVNRIFGCTEIGPQIDRPSGIVLISEDDLPCATEGMP